MNGAHCGAGSLAHLQSIHNHAERGEATESGLGLCRKLGHEFEESVHVAVAHRLLEQLLACTALPLFEEAPDMGLLVGDEGIDIPTVDEKSIAGGHGRSLL